MTDSATLHNQIDSMRDLISNAQNKIENGEIIDLSGLNIKTQNICRDVLNLPAEEAKEFKPIMLDVISQLNALESSLQNFNKDMNQMKEKLT